jgi:hypothetical protein
MEGLPITNERESNIEFPQIAEQILKMREIDQAMRSDEASEWDVEVDRNNTAAMKGIINEIGWPTVTKVGAEASRAAWLLVQHADEDPAFQKQCLLLMKEQATGEVEARDMAYLEDRIRVNTGQKQVYGTQMFETRDEHGQISKYEPQPIEDPEQVNERRASVGLETIEEYIQMITGRYYPHLLKKVE